MKVLNKQNVLNINESDIIVKYNSKVQFVVINSK